MSCNEKRIWKEEMHAILEESIQKAEFVENDIQQEMDGKIL